LNNKNQNQNDKLKYSSGNHDIGDERKKENGKSEEKENARNAESAMENDEPFSGILQTLCCHVFILLSR